MCIIIYIVYGRGSDTFTRPEAQFAYNFPFAYFKGPPAVVLRMAIDIAHGEGTVIGIGTMHADETFVLAVSLLGVNHFLSYSI